MIRLWSGHPQPAGPAHGCACLAWRPAAITLAVLLTLAMSGCGESPAPGAGKPATSLPAAAQTPAAPAADAALETWQALLLRRETSKTFEDVVFELEFAITERNYRITGRNTIGRALRERGYADFPDAEVIHFCSLERAREVLLLDPSFLALMPCRVSVHVENGKTVVQGNLLPTTHVDSRVVEFALGVNQALRDIIEFATQPEG